MTQPILARPSPSHTRCWIGRGFWTIADQALLSGSNFIVSVLLARHLSASDYGSFTVAFAIFSFIGDAAQRAAG